MRTRIKMCGTTRREDAEKAVELGIDALGFIFAEKSPRYIAPVRAAKIIALLPPLVARVGVFVNCDQNEVKEIVSLAGLTQVQLHGSEPPEMCRELREWNPSITVCKSFLIGPELPFPDVQGYHDSVHCVLLDTYKRGMDGGTGQAFDWGVINDLSLSRPLFLAGGLNPDNVARAVTTVAPYAIDVNSGVEDQPGIKNHDLLAKLMVNVRQADKRLAEFR